MTAPQKVLEGLAAHHLPTPSAQWLSTLVSGQRQSTPLPAVLATAKLRLLSSDLTTTALLTSSTPYFPPNLTDTSIRESRLPIDTHVQVVGIEDMSQSRYAQLEAIEAVERGETTRGREVIRLAPPEEGDNGMPHVAAPQVVNSLSKSSGPHKLVLQDWKGERVFGMEIKRVEKVGLGMDIGTKILLRKGIVIARGVVLLEPGSCLVLGGKVEALHKAWMSNRKKELKDAIEAGS